MGVLRPHHAEHAEFGEGGGSAHDGEHARVFFGVEAELAGEGFVDVSLHDR